jgi:hypothetical protein
VILLPLVAGKPRASAHLYIEDPALMDGARCPLPSVMRLNTRAPSARLNGRLNCYESERLRNSTITWRPYTPRRLFVATRLTPVQQRTNAESPPYGQAGMEDLEQSQWTGVDWE